MKRIFMMSVLLLTVATNSRATPIYNEVTDHYYEFVDQWVTWDEADTIAESMVYNGRPGHLVTVTSAEESLWIGENISVGETWNIWLGAYQDADATEVDEGWNWVTGEPWDFTNWEPYSPDDANWWGETTPNVETGDENYITYVYNWDPATGWMWIDRNGEFERPFVVEYEALDVPDPACFMAVDSIVLADRTYVTIGEMVAGGDVNVGVQSSVEGNITAGGNLVLRGQNWGPNEILGDVTLGGTVVSQSTNNYISGTLLDGAVVDAVVVDALSVNSGGESKYCPTAALEPGKYGQVMGWGGCTLTLKAGEYEFDSLSLYSGSTLGLLVADDEIVKVRTKVFFFGDNVEVDGVEDAAHLSVYTEQNYSVGIGGTGAVFLGTIIAPNAETAIYRGTDFEGCIHAKSIRVDPDNGQVVGSTPVLQDDNDDIPPVV